MIQLKRYVAKKEKRTIDGLKSELKKTKKKVQLLFNSLEGVYRYFLNIESGLEKGDSDSVGQSIKNIGRWSPSINRKEKKKLNI